MERPPLSSFFKGTDEYDEYPTFSPSTLRTTQKPSVQMGASLPTPQMASEPIKAQKPSLLSNIKDKAVGVLKGVGQSVFDTGKLVAQESPNMLLGSVTPPGVKVPGFDKLPGAQKGINKVQSILKPSNEVQQGAKDFEQTAEILLPFLAGGANAVTKMPRLAQALEEASLRLTPGDKRALGAKIEGVSQWLVQNGITGSPASRTSKVDAIYQETEKKLTKFLKENNTNKGYFVPKEAFIKDLEAIKNKFRNSRDFDTVVRQVDDAISNVKTIFRNSRIPVERFNEYKRSVFDGAFNKAGTKVLDEVEFSVGDAAKNVLERALRGAKIDGKDIGLFNKEYSYVINARKLLRAAESRDEVGFVGKLVASMGGAGLGMAFGGGPLGAAFGASIAPSVAPVLAGTAVRSNVGQIANTIGKLEPAAKKALASLLLGAETFSASRLERILNGETDEEADTVPAPEVPKEGRVPLESFNR